MRKSFVLAIALFAVISAGSSVVAAPDFSLKGYGTGTTGGAGGTMTTVTSVAELDAFAAAADKNTAARILNIKGKISYSGKPGYVIAIKRSRNITIQGDATSGGELVNIGFNLVDDTNVIVQNLYIHEVLYDSDGLTIDGCNKVWVNRCEMHSKVGTGITVDTYDGLLDIKKGSTNVTISWCVLHDHMKCSLIGHTDKTGNGDENITVTYHHNWFLNTDGRNPSIRFGTAHLYNNIFENITDYGLASRDGAHVKVENCIYRNVKLSMSTDKFPVDGFPNGYICQSGNEITNSGAPVISQTGCEFFTSSKLPYSYTPESLAAFGPSVRANAGVPGRTVKVFKASERTVHSNVNVITTMNKNGISIVSMNKILNVIITDMSGRVAGNSFVNADNAMIAMHTTAGKVYNVKIETVAGVVSQRVVR
jgi:pectate lyase